MPEPLDKYNAYYKPKQFTSTTYKYEPYQEKEYRPPPTIGNLPEYVSYKYDAKHNPNIPYREVKQGGYDKLEPYQHVFPKYTTKYYAPYKEPYKLKENYKPYQAVEPYKESYKEEEPYKEPYKEEEPYKPEEKYKPEEPYKEPYDEEEPYKEEEPSEEENKSEPSEESEEEERYR